MSDQSNGMSREDMMERDEPQMQVENPKNADYVRELVKEKMSLEPCSHSHAMKLIDDEIQSAQAKGSAKKEGKFMDIYREKPIKISVKVLVPVKEHPRFNFVGKLLGPKGNSLKRLQEETMTRMAILGRGSMRDRQKEEEYRQSLDPKYAHLADELHVEIVALAAPAEAHARIAYALAELRKYLVPDSNDDIRMEQLREMQTAPGRPRGPPRGPPARGPGMGAVPLLPRPLPGKAKVLSILDRARVAMEDTYEEPYYDAPPAAYDAPYNGGGDYYDNSYNEGGGGGGGGGRWKGYGNGGGGGGGGKAPVGGRFPPRGAPYARPPK